jgi:protein-disulfide isomerase
MSQRAKNLVLLGILLVAGALAAVLIAVSVTGGDDEATTGVVHGAEATEALFDGIPQRGNVLGKPKAPVTIVEYADFQCPFCAQFARDTLPAIVDEYVRPGKVRIVFQGIAILGPDSLTALQAAVSAGMQNRLWNYGELLFHNQGEENSGWVTDDLLKTLATGLGLDYAKLEADADGPAALQQANSMAAEGEQRKVPGTPWFYVQIGDAAPYEVQPSSYGIDQFRPILDDALSG